jgi:hypothetical protein
VACWREAKRDPQKSAKSEDKPTDKEEAGAGCADKVKGPLDGIRFPPLSGPGPCGLRPEHVEAVLRGRRAVAIRMGRMLRELMTRGASGDLPKEAKWILSSSLTFLDKPGKAAPRPIRAGEYWRKIITKSMIKSLKNKIQALMIKFGQYGVALPGGAEAAFHARFALEEKLRSDGSAKWVIVDVDLVNCFGQFEWDSIRDAYAETIPEMLAWERWCGEADQLIQLPCGDRVGANRGAGQGESDGPLKAAVTIGWCAAQARMELAAGGITAWSDIWYLDDGQIVCRPEDVERILVALDKYLERAGASRGRKSAGDQVKSTVRIFCEGESRDKIVAEMRPRTVDSCAIESGKEPCRVLGVGWHPGQRSRKSSTSWANRSRKFSKQ